MRCFCYYSSKNNQPQFHWLYPSTAIINTSCKAVSNLSPLQASAVSRHSHWACWLLHCFTQRPVHKHPAVLSSKHLVWHLWVLVCHSALFLLSFLSNQMSVSPALDLPMKTGFEVSLSRNGCVTTNPSLQINANRYLQINWLLVPLA